MTTASDCIFCAIVQGRAPAHRIYEDDRILVFMDLFPAHEGHSLIIPKAHGRDLFEIHPDDLAAVICQSVALGRALHSVFDPDGIAVMQLNGAAAGQTVFHYHMHLIPRNQGEAFATHGKQRADDAVLAEHAARLSAAFIPED